jgi:hypothetical protein
LLTPHAFLRRLPNAVRLEDRLILDALVTACDLAEVAYSQLVQLLSELTGEGTEPPRASPHDRARLAVCAWAIVDNIHNFRSFARKLQMDPDGELATFVLTYEVATKMRNAMDHRSSNLGNLSSRARLDPVYGALSFFAPRRGDGSKYVHQLSLGGLHHDSHVFPIVDTWRKPTEKTISNLQMAAFDKMIDFSKAMEGLLSAQRYLNGRAERSITQQIEHDAQINAYSASEVLNDISGGAAWMVLALPDT